jgi:hypothetical protein
VIPLPKFWPFGLVFVDTLVGTLTHAPFTSARRYA